METTLRLLLVDPDLDNRRHLMEIAQAVPQLHVIGSCNSLDAALHKVLPKDPNLILLSEKFFAQATDLRLRFPMAQVLIAGTRNAHLSLPNRWEVRHKRELATQLQDIAQRQLQVVEQETNRYLFNRPPQRPQTSARPAQSSASLLSGSRPPSASPRSGYYKWLLIGSSTGGPEALQTVLRDLRRPLLVPTLIVQHMPQRFTELLAANLRHQSGMEVEEVRGVCVPRPGVIYLAQGGQHMKLLRVGGGYELRQDDGPPVCNCRPAVDVLFSSVAQAVHDPVLSVILTGMGRDGTDGMQTLRKNRVTCLVQDQHSSVVWGMPGSVYKAGFADEVLALEDIPRRINEHLQRSV
jgi:two-component system chemotaxis response regulator CheB